MSDQWTSIPEGPVAVFRALMRASKRFPQQRAGQLIDNALVVAKRPEDLFSIGDKELTEALEAYSRLVDV